MISKPTLIIIITSAIILIIGTGLIIYFNRPIMTITQEELAGVTVPEVAVTSPTAVTITAPTTPTTTSSTTSTTSSTTSTTSPTTPPSTPPNTSPTSPAPSPIAVEEPESSGITMATVSTHNSETSCWTAINGSVYELTEWIGRHPGGPGNIKKLCGIDGTALFTNKHSSSSNAQSALVLLKIGELAE